MQTTIDLAFWISVILLLTREAGLILRPHQQQYVADLVEALTLRLEYIRPLLWLKGRSLRTQARPLLLIGSSQLLLLVAYGFSRTNLPAIRSGTAGVTDQIYVLALLLPMNLGVWSLTILFVQHLMQKPNPTRIALCWAVFAPLFPRLLTNTYVLVSTLIHYTQSGELACTFDAMGTHRVICHASPVSYLGAVGSLGAMLFGPVAIQAALAIEIVLAIVLVAGSTTVLEVALRFMRGVGWRLVEHKHGAFAGILAITAVLLGIAKLLLGSS
ncbi:MAG TPA: hypothetical protein VGR37_02550 [Longimicrobiaceae bacterium]|nr:hypothetical protein [Longimicrobiaceae bacterium]